jgi:hypothetical protein
MLPVITPGEVGRSKDHNNHVPSIALFFLFMLPISAPTFDPILCISSTDDVTEVMFVSIASSAAHLWWSDVAGRVPMKAFPVVIIMALFSVLLVIDLICYHCCVQHHLEPLDMRVDLFIILGEMGVI